MNQEDTTGQKKIMVIEDENHIAEGLKLNLSLQGYDVKVISDGISAISEWNVWKPDLIVLDLMLPGLDGYSVLKNIRLENEKLPILILSAKDSVQDKIEGFSRGVDDYLSKPFVLEEFLLRVSRLLTRASWSKNSVDLKENDLKKIYQFGKNKIDFTLNTATCRQGEIKLTSQEIKLLKLFVTNPQTPLSRQLLLETCWGYDGKISTRTLDNFIVRFRKYFEENPKEPVYFKSLRSVGYIFNNP